MQLSVITLFPEMFRIVTDYGVIGKAVKRGFICIELWNPRNFTCNRHQRVDDRPYGGGAGMLMTIKPLKNAISHAKNILGNNVKVVYLSPQGRTINQDFIRNFIYDNKRLILVCGRYQGIDERVINTEIDEEWSIGDYVLSGGELAAMVLIDVMSRLLPNVLGNKKSQDLDSFSALTGMLDCPHYSRPSIFENMEVPSVLLSGDHFNICRWKLKQSLGNTWIKRPDLFNNIQLTDEQRILLAEFKKEYFLSLKK